MAADPRDQMRADRERHRREAEDDQRDWRHDTLDLDPVVGELVQGEVVQERTRGGALHAGRQVLGSARRSVRSAPRRVPAGVVVGVLLLAGAGAVSAVASDGPLGQPSVVSQAPPSGSGSSGSGETGPSVVVGDGRAAPAGPPAAGPPAGGPPGLHRRGLSRPAAGARRRRGRRPRGRPGRHRPATTARRR